MNHTLPTKVGLLALCASLKQMLSSIRSAFGLWVPYSLHPFGRHVRSLTEPEGGMAGDLQRPNGGWAIGEQTGGA